MSLLLPIAAGAAASAPFTVYPRTQSRVTLIDADGATIPRHAQVKIQWQDLNGQWYDHSTLSGGLDSQASAVLEPGVYRVLRVDNNSIVGVELDNGTDRAGASIANAAPADTTRAVLYGWATSAYERLSSALGQLFVRAHGSEGTALFTAAGGRLGVTLDGERFSAAQLTSVAVTDVFAAFPSYAANWIEISNTSTKVIAYRRGTSGAEATIPIGATRKIILVGAGNTNNIQVRNATDNTSLTVVGDALRRASV